MFEIPYVSIAITLIVFILLVVGYLWVDEIIKTPKRERKHKRIKRIRRLR